MAGVVGCQFGSCFIPRPVFQNPKFSSQHLQQLGRLSSASSPRFLPPSPSWSVNLHSISAYFTPFHSLYLSLVLYASGTFQTSRISSPFSLDLLLGLLFLSLHWVHLWPLIWVLGFGNDWISQRGVFLKLNSLAILFGIGSWAPLPLLGLWASRSLLLGSGVILSFQCGTYLELNSLAILF